MIKRLRNCPLKRVNNSSEKNQAMDKTPSSCAVDKYMSKISKVLACTKKFKIVVLVAEVCCVNFFFLQFYHSTMCLNKNAQY